MIITSEARVRVRELTVRGEERIEEANEKRMCQVPGPTGGIQGQRQENILQTHAGFAGCANRAIQSASEGLISPG